MPSELTPSTLDRLKRRAARGRTRPASGGEAIRPRPRAADAPLSFAQQRLWFLHELYPDNFAHNIADAYRLRGPLNEICLRASLDAIARRHDVLRTTFATNAQDEVVQVVHEPQPCPLPVTEVPGVGPAERLATARQMARERVRRPFDLRRLPLWHAELLRLGADDHVLLLWFHHAIADRWSFGVLADELCAIYRATLAGEVPALGALPIQYADFAVWERQRFDRGALDPHLHYWRRQLAGVEPVALPFDHMRPAVRTFEGRQFCVHVPPAVVRRLTETARRHNATLFTVLAAGMAALLSRYSGQEDVAFGAAVSNRTRLELEPLVGLLVNMLVLRTDVSGNPSFSDLIRRVRETIMQAHEHRDVPFEKLVEILVPERDLSRPPLVNIGLTFFNLSGRGLAMPGIAVDPFQFDAGIAQLDIDVALTERDEQVTVDVSYAADLFDPATIERLFTSYSRLLEAAADDPSLSVAALPVVDDEHARELLAWGDAPAPEAPPLRPIHELFEQQAAATPHEVAVSCDERQLTYAELNSRANRVARCLRDAGIGPESVVGVYAGRSPEAIVACLAVLKAGGAYLPLDPEYPPERVARILADARASIAVVSGDVAGRLPAHVQTISAGDEEAGAHGGDDLAVSSAPGSLAYVVYTSGSTGEPKGVMVEHGGVVNLCWWMKHRAGLRPGEVTCWFGSPAFDISVMEIWPSLLAGARIDIIRDSRLAPHELQRRLIERGVTVAVFAVAVAEELLALDWPAAVPLRIVFTGADRLRRRPRPAIPFELVNNYGPTETTVLASSGRVDPHGSGFPRIGTPLWNTRLYVLDAHRQLVPEGVTGELYVAGAGVARGYLGRPDETAERFIDDPYGPPGARCYRTGDLVRWRNGELEFVGRSDDQVKLRGYRVELAEIESVLRRQPGIRDAAARVVQEEDGRARLVGYVVTADRAPADAAALLHALHQELPAFMVPSAIVELAEMPLTTTGKIDRARLPVPDEPQIHGPEPRDRAEAVVADVWARALGVSRIGVHDDFFELGGHSLLAMQAASQLRRELGVDIDVRSIFEYPTVEAFVSNVVAASRPVSKEGASL
uniref:Non-ribosomal peptide synthetase n=1 Tax=uncultured bacterium AZ_379 TaxID=1630015 RepID=A0A0E3GLX1_9BACT|nr:non-ribosomal peptide synthetase [uncultured bacterium AZ_379]